MLDILLQRKLEKDEKRNTIIFSILFILIILILVNVFYLNFSSHTFLSSQSNQTQQNENAPSPSPTPTSMPTDTPAPTHLAPQISEYYIPLGSGTNNTSDWADVPGAQASVDLSSYSGVTKIVFEAATFVPTANQIVWVRLYDETDNYPVSGTELMFPSNQSGYQTSSPITFGRGTKTYSVQMKTQLQSPANLNLARIHIYVQ